MANEIKTELTLDINQFLSALEQAKKEGAKSAKEAGDGVSKSLEQGIASGFGSIKSQIIALGTTVLGAFTFKEAIGEAIEAQNAMQSLRGAMALAGQDAASASAQFKTFAENLQRTTGVSDDLIVKNASLLISLGKLSGEGLQQASKAALDLSAGRMIPLEEAFEKVARAAQGHTESLKRLGIEVKKTGDATTDFNAALEKISSAFGGQAQAQFNTFGGALKGVANAFKDVLEEIGKLFVQSKTLQAVFKLVIESLNAAAKSIQQFGQTGDVIADVILNVIQFGKVVNKYIVLPLELAYNTAVVVFDGIKTGIQLAITGLATAIGPLAEGLAKIFPDTFGAFNESMQAFKDSSTVVLKDFVAQTQESAGKIFDFDVTAATENYLIKSQEFVEGTRGINEAIAIETTKNIPTIESTWTQILNNVKIKLVEFSNFVKMTSAAMVQSIQTFSSGLGRAFAQVGTNLATGASAFKDFGKILLSVLGDIAIQFGTTFILMGIGKSLLFDPTGPALIAAGAALAVVGGVLKALGGGASGVGGGAANVGAGLSPGDGGGAPLGGPSFATEQQELREDKPGTAVQVVIQGNVLDRRETGLAIAEIINENFGSNGVNFAST